MKHLFLDTNVVLDFLIDRRPFSTSAAKLFDHSEKGHIKIYLSAVSYTTIYYIVKKLSTHKETINVLKGLEKISETIDTTKEIIHASLNSGLKDFEDAIQYYSATSNKKITAIVTRDLSDFKHSEISTIDPDEALSLIESTRP